MAKAKSKAKAKGAGPNILFVGKDGKIVIASGTGDVTVTSAAALGDDLIKLIKKRQEEGKELTEALATAKFAVAHSWVVVVVDPSDALPKLGKKKMR